MTHYWLLPALRAGLVARRLDSAADRPSSEVARGHAPGYDPDKLLIVGSGPTLDEDVTNRDALLSGAVAHATSARSGRGCDVDVLTRTDLRAAQVSELIGSLRLGSYDAIIFAVGEYDAIRGTSLTSWRSSVAEIIQLTLSSTTGDTGVFFVEAQPIRSRPRWDTILGGVAPRHADALSRTVERLCSENSRTSFLLFPDPVTAALTARDNERVVSNYDAWAAGLAPAIVLRLNAGVSLDGDRRQHRTELDEIAGQLTVDGLPRAELAHELVLRELIELAHRAFRIETAMLTIVDGDRHTPVLTAGTEFPGVQRRHSFCDVVLQQTEPLVVLDATLDDRFRDNPLVTGEPHIRFYAGIPISDPSGERIGALCLVDTHPRRRKDDIDLTFLRELTVLVEQELGKFLRRADDLDSRESDSS